MGGKVAELHVSGRNPVLRTVSRLTRRNQMWHPSTGCTERTQHTEFILRESGHNTTVSDAGWLFDDDFHSRKYESQALTMSGL